jgi:hypothetical protein
VGGCEQLNTNLFSQCVTLFNATGVPNSQSLKTGMQFTHAQSTMSNDSACAADYVAPRLSFQVSRAILPLANLHVCQFANSRSNTGSHGTP